LLLDMPICWSSTYVMIDRAEKNEKFVDIFVYELGLQADSIVKRQKIDELKLTEEEWGQVKLFTGLLAHADNAQQSFSSDKGPTLQHALPALEALHKAWSKHAEAARYKPFQEGLTATTDKIMDYYEHTADSDAYTYTLIILLDPSQKDVYFKKYWGKELHAQVLKNVEQLEQYIQMYGDGGPLLPEKKKDKLPQVLHELSSDEDEIAEEEDHDVDPQSPWLKEFNLYLHSATSIADGVSIVQWWGLNAQQYPVWASLAQNYLSIMASSVSSERAFSAAALTITKHHNCLKGDVVEAIQVLRMLYNRSLMFHEPAPSSVLELMYEEEKEGAVTESTEGEDLSWILELSDDSDLYA
ncbi:hypothetical protein PAXRUDRAFT_164595, partial [Paxillus rubicundulus Ve08.2h10]